MERTTVKVKEAAEMLSLDPSTIRRYGKQGKLLIVDSRLVSVASIEAYANGENRTWQSDQKVRRVGVEVSAAREVPTKRQTEHGESRSGLKAGLSAGGPLQPRKPSR